MIIQGDCIEVLKTLEDNSVDSIVTDPPYGISFMGKKWDYDVPKIEMWKECMRVLKPGGHALVACGTRTQHRMAVNLEDAGFEIRDIVAWVYGSGFPKSHNIAIAIDKQSGEMEHRGRATAHASTHHPDGTKHDSGKAVEAHKPMSEDSKKYEGWGTALKPAMELWTLCRKPLEEKTIASNVLKYGTGGINIDGCRVGTDDKLQVLKNDTDEKDLMGNMKGKNAKGRKIEFVDSGQGRFPANLIHDGSDEVVELMGDPQRFFYTAKASKSERNAGLEGFEEVKVSDGRDKEADNAFQRGKTMRVNSHPTVKPVKLMQYLVRLITPKGGTVLDPFMGSGTTGIAAKTENFEFIGIELDPDYCKIAEARIKNTPTKLL